ncbi:endothelin-converting enzyme homolog isoform X2 [Gordionus sp. m RMFG-2023]|uniref:endothelin-converting enzyme homolog isoform X2 n=1 Tax=Gordionus sp. m RMFG-2023 TaxID=3053472 RepID=UPI0031FD35A0
MITSNHKYEKTPSNEQLPDFAVDDPNITRHPLLPEDNGSGAVYYEGTETLPDFTFNPPPPLPPSLTGTGNMDRFTPLIDNKDYTLGFKDGSGYGYHPYTDRDQYPFDKDYKAPDLNNMDYYNNINYDNDFTNGAKFNATTSPHHSNLTNFTSLNYDQQKNPYSDPPQKPKTAQQPIKMPPSLANASNINRRADKIYSLEDRNYYNKAGLLGLLAHPIYLFKNFWNRRSKLERAFLSLLLSSLFVIMVLSFVIKAGNQRYGKLLNRLDLITDCISPDCITISARLLNSMNLSVDPCHDFYNYACGGWVQDNNIPDGQSTWNNFQALFQKNQYILRKILERKETTYESESEVKAKIYYESCLDENDTIEMLGAQPILDLLSRYGGWNFSALNEPSITPFSFNLSSPDKLKLKKQEDSKLLRKLLPKDWDFQDRMERISMELDISLLFSVYVSDDDKNSSNNALYLDMGRISLPKRDYYLNMSLPENKEILTAYFKYMIGVGLLLGDKLEQQQNRQLRSLLQSRLMSGPFRKKGENNLKINPPLIRAHHLSSSDKFAQEDMAVSKFSESLVMMNLEREIFEELENGDDSLPPNADRKQLNNAPHDSSNNTIFARSAYADYYRLITRSMANVLTFETTIANFTPPQEMLRNGERNYNPMTLKEIQEKYDFINWTHYLNELFSLVNVTISEDQVIIVRSLDYMANITKLVKEYKSTIDKKTILNNYFMWHITSRMIAYLSQEFKATLRPLSKALKGSFDSVVAWKTCISDTNTIIGFPLGSLFVKETFKGRNKIMAEAMINKIKQAFKNQLPTLDWMDEETIKVASAKADAIRNKIGFPDYLLSPKELDKKFEGLSFKSDAYFENNLRQIEFFLKKSLGKIRQPVDKARWSLTPPMVNAYYLATGNEMVFPAGILQSPFYDSTFPKALNFGAMGFVVGHELTHGFDDLGRQFDKNGNMKPWWNNASIEKFNLRAECLEKQYSEYKLEQLNINGKQTIGENIADNGGLKATFAAFRSYMASNPEYNPTLPGLNMTDNQLFFLAFAQVWCSIDTKKSLYFEIQNDSHSPNKIRVIGTLSNSVEFSKAYNCPLKSPMNPSEKCVVW